MRSRVMALVAVLALAVACTTDEHVRPRGPASSATPPASGGTLRLGIVGDFGADLDPQVAYDTLEWELFRCCLLRTLFSYNGLPASEGGAEARPDLAVGPPEVSPDGLTWTVHLKPGIHYAPPLADAEITAQDVVRALMRVGSPSMLESNPSNYGFYYSVIEGFDAYRAGETKTIPGLETPGDHTLVLRLTEPAGDLPYRLAMPATAPIPPNPFRPDAVFGVAEDHMLSWAHCVHGGVYGSCGYGHYLVASGPYMIEGSEDLDLSLPPKDQSPASGFSTPRYVRRSGGDWGVAAPGTLTLVRNPSWDPAADDLRAAYPDRIEVQLRGAHSFFPALHRRTVDEFMAAVESGSIDVAPDLVYTPGQMDRYRADPQTAGRVAAAPGSFVYFIVMNLALPPFDDLHVRRAVAFAIDESELTGTVVREPTFPAQGAGVATHIAPDAIEGDLLAGYDPYPASRDRARQEMARSRYDGDGDGTCDGPECDGVRALVRADGFGSAAADLVVAWLAGLGIRLRTTERSWDRIYGRAWTERAQVPLLMGLGWGYDYPNASGVFPPLFSLSGATAVAGAGSLVGASPAQLERWGYDVREVPSADERIDRCVGLSGRDQTECWADLDRYLMERVVPVVPFMATQHAFVVSDRVASWSCSPATINLAFDRIALVPGSDRGGVP